MTETAIERFIDLALMPAGDLPEPARALARCSLFDWMVVGTAGRNEPLSRKIRDSVTGEGGRETASLIGGGKAPARGAALVNGTISHALDYDDTHFAHVGHPSVAIYPAALAAAEDTGASAADVADAFLVGAEGSIRLGLMLGHGHYNRGFHQTATAGAFGATMAAARIYGLERTRLRHALGLCATRASGLKSQFGTMGKPLNAGIAASNGVECARLAGQGFTSCDDGIAGPQGFIETHSDEPDLDRPWQDAPPATFLFEDIKYKLHACCHGTHAMIEALRSAMSEHALQAGDVAGLGLAVNPRWLKVCDIKAPRTGLEVKFSYAFLAGMVLTGMDTSADRTYADALASDPALKTFAARVRVEGDGQVTDTATEGEIETTDGRRVPIAHDLAARMPLDTVQAGLRGKARALLGEDGADVLWSTVEALDSRDAGVIGDLLRA